MKSTGKITAIIAATAALSMLAATSASAEERHRDGTRRDNGGYSRDNGGHRDNNNYRNESRNNNTYRNDSRSNTYRNESRSNTYRNESRNNNNYRNESRSNNYRNESRSNGYRGEHRDDHFSERGHISRFTRERDGYRVWLGGARSYWIPSYRLGGRRLALGLDIRLGGIFNGTYVDVDALGWPGDPYYNDGYYAPAPAPYYADGYLRGRVERVDLRDGTLLLRDDRSGRVIEADMRATDRRGGLDLDDLRPGDRVTLDGTWDRGYFHAYRIDGVRPY